MCDPTDKKVIGLWKSRYDSLQADFKKLAYAFYLMYGGEEFASEDGFALLREHGLIDENDEWILDDE